jgi:hypothetical protein
MSCSLEDRYKSFGAACFLLLQVEEWQRQQVPVKQWYVLLKLHSFMNKKTPILFEIWLRSGTADSNHDYISNDVIATHSTKSTSHCSLNCALLVVLRSSVIQLLNLSKSSHDFDLLALWMKRNRTYSVALNWQWYEPFEESSHGGAQNLTDTWGILHSDATWKYIIMPIRACHCDSSAQPNEFKPYTHTLFWDPF